MATTVDIPEHLLREAQELTGLTTKKAIINRAIIEMVQVLRQKHALEDLSSMKSNPFMSEEEINQESAALEEVGLVD